MKKTIWNILLSVAVILGGVLPNASFGPLVVPALAAPTNILHLRVESARQWIPSGLNKGDAINNYHWLITEDDTGDPTHYGTTLGITDTLNSNFACKPQSIGGDPAYPANCQWPSIHAAKGGTTAEVIAQGDQTTLDQLTHGIDTSTWPAPNDHNPNRSYMVTVMAGGYTIPGCVPTATTTCKVDGFKVDSAWFSLPLNGPGADPGLVTVDLQPYPLPLTTIRMQVWNDLQTNMAYDTGEPNLAGWEGHIADIAGVVTVDWFGNPLCTVYQHDANGLMMFDANGKPLIQTIGGHCYSDANGVITIPYLGAGRYSSTVVPPNGQTWYQTTTLEGWHDWDTWSIQGWNGYDPEFVQGAEPFPFAEFGFVQVQTCGLAPANPSAGQAVGCPGAASFAPGDATINTTPLTGSASNTGSIKGQVVGAGQFAPTTGGLTIGGANGGYVIEKIKQPLISLIDTNLNDNTVYVARGNADGTFQINHVPDGDYVLSYWDEDQAYLLTQSNVSIVNGQAIDLGVLDVSAWWSQLHGKVCFDTNRNGKCDPGEPGIPGLTLNLLGRDNTLQFYGDNTAVTDKDGNYSYPRAYPLGQWVVAQGYWEQYYTVGVTYQTNNQPAETTVMANGGFVDVSTYNIIGMVTRMDWAIHTYETPANAALGPTNGGIVGEMVYNTTRIESDARFESSQPNEPGIPDFNVHLYWPVKCDPTLAAPAGETCTQTTTSFGNNYYLTNASTGEYIRGPEAQVPYTSETWQRPQDCTALDANGVPVVQQVLPPPTGGHDCLEAPMMASQVGNNSVGPFMQVNGNYGFTEIITDSTGAAIPGGPIPIPSGDWLVAPEVPTNPVDGKPAWRASMEEDVNIFSGDKLVAPGETQFNPPTPVGAAAPVIGTAIPPFPCVGALHTVDVVTSRVSANFDVLNPSATAGVYNPDYAAAGGSPYQGQSKPLCNVKMVTVRPGRSATPNFYWQPASDVPLPGRIFGLIVDDLNLSVNPKELFYGEKYGIPNVPIGIYDFSDRLIKTVYSDPNGVFEVNLPSTDSFNCTTPSSICPGIYRFYGNDPGPAGHPNPGYNPGYRSIGAFFEVWPGISLPADLAPSPVSFGIENPGTQTSHPAACLLNDPNTTGDPAVPEFYNINKPYVRDSDTGTARNFTINGQYFGALQGGGSVTLDGVAMPIVSWNDRQIVFRVPANAADGPHQLKVNSANGQTTVNSLTFHVMDTGYTPQVFEVGPGRTYNSTTDAHAIQHALDAAAFSPGNGPKMVVVYAGTPGSFNPLGSYFENLIIHSPVKLQGIGPGGVYADGTAAAGSVIDGLGFGTDGPRETAWAATLASLGTIIGPNGLPAADGTAAVPEGEVILAVAQSTTQYTLSNGNPLPVVRRPSIDGFMIQNGDVMDFVPNVNSLGNGGQVGGGNNTPTNPNQGGGIVAFASTKSLQITNNIIRSNAGAYSGAIRLGTPLVGTNNLDNIRISNNRILNNGGTNLAGAIGIFNGTTSYQVTNNDICGNFSAEYGGGISHFGLSQNGTIHDNRIYFNGSYDEGGGVIIAGEPPLTPTGLSAGAGAVDVYNNRIQANLANDDGGGLRFLSAGNFPYNVFNNMIVNNISAHEGGGVAIDNAPNVRFFNNTVMKNITTATAATSNGQPAPAGLSSAENNAYLQATLPSGSPAYSNPLMFNNIFWDNRAGRWDGANIVGIGGMVWSNGVLVPDPTPVNYWDLGVPGTAFLLSTTNSILEPTANPGALASGTNQTVDPMVIAPFDASVSGLPWRGNPNFVANTIVALDVPVTIMGDYHLSGIASPAVDRGAASKAAPTYQQPPATINAPSIDIDNQARPARAGYDIGADEVGAQADVSITKSDGLTTVLPGQTVSYQIVAANAGPDALAGVRVADTFPASLTNVLWCRVTVGTTCTPSVPGNINQLVNLASGGSTTFIARGTLVTSPTSATLANTATVTPPAGTNDTNTANNSATDTDTIPSADLSITVSDGQSNVSPNQALGYSIVVANAGPDNVTNAPVTDNFPASLTGVIWTCSATPGSSCSATGPTAGNINSSVSLLAGGSATFNASASVVSNPASVVLANTASVITPGPQTDFNPANNNATDTDMVSGIPFAQTSILDNFNRANGALGANWGGTLLQSLYRVNANQMQVRSLGGWAFWNGASSSFGANQEAFVTIAAPLSATAVRQDLLLKENNPSALTPGTSYIDVRYDVTTHQVSVETVAPAPQGRVVRLTFAATLAANDVLGARALQDGTVIVYQNGSQIGSVNVTSGATPWAFSGAGGHIGVLTSFTNPLATTNQVIYDNFGGGTLP